MAELAELSRAVRGRSAVNVPRTFGGCAVYTPKLRRPARTFVIVLTAASNPAKVAALCPTGLVRTRHYLKCDSIHRSRYRARSTSNKNPRDVSIARVPYLLNIPSYGLIFTSGG